MTTAQAVGAVSREAAEWYAMDWQAINRNVRRLPVRIVQATKASRWGKVRALQRLLIPRNRVSPKEAFEGLELCERELSCTVPRGLDGSNPVRLLGHARNRLQTPSEASSFLQAGRKLSRWCNGRSCRPWIDQNAA